MTTKDSFSDEDWDRIVRAPFVAGFAVTAADPGGLIGAVQESSAMVKSVRDAQASAPEGSLIDDLDATFMSAEGREAARSGLKALIKGRTPTEAGTAAVAELQATMTMLHTKAPAHAAVLAQIVRDTAQNVANAAIENTFLGFGGEKVSDAERKTLADIDAAVAAPTG